ncbi:MAG: hypothetical protein HQL66_11775, partial [Magnetococcales bacterium]|nr:hypothetical protein [Magnetococcales bacterium]
AQAGRMLDALVPKVVHTSEMVADIDQLSNAQSSGAQAISGALTNLDRVVGENAATSGHITEISQELIDMAESLDRALGAFQVSDHPGE